MAKPKTPKPAKPTRGASKAPSDAKPTSPNSAPALLKTRHRAVLDRLLAKHPPLNDVQRKVFSARYTDARCDEMGARTRSEGVLNEAVAWAPEMAKAIKKHPKALRRYQPARLAWFLTCIRDLADAREEQAIAEGNTDLAKTRAERAKRAALDARGELLETLEEVVEGHEDEEAALATAAGATDTVDRTATSLRVLAAYGRGWLAREDAASRELVSAAGLTLAEVEAAEAAAEALIAAGEERALEGKAIARDTPPVNRVEGRLLLEMRAAMRVFGNANAKNKDVPKLVPGAATRAVLAPPAGNRKAKKDDATASSSEPVAPPPTP